MRRLPRQSAVLLLAVAAVAAAALWVATAGGPQGQPSAPPSDSALPASATTLADGAASAAACPNAAARVHPEAPGCAHPADGAGSPAPGPGLPPALAAMAGAGLIAAIDPETGELGSPNAEQLSALRAKSVSSEDPMEGLLEIHHPDGSVSVRDLSGRFLQFEIARVGPDGSLRASCAQGPEQAAARMRDTAAPPAAALEVK